MDTQQIIERIAQEVKESLQGEGSGHDWWHIHRVWRMARRIGHDEGVNIFVIELTALLHDIGDWKFHDGDDTVGPKIAREVLSKYDIPKNVIAHVCDIISTMSFKGAGVPTKMQTLEGEVVQDADRLDAIGAIGIARAFAYGGHKNRLIHDPEQNPVFHQTKDEYFQAKGATINHFHEKLLLLKERMNTRLGKRIAEERHRYMNDYLCRFYNEWRGDI